MSAGIDYGMGLANVDRETGIRYGVISVASVEWWYDRAEYGEPTCPECGEGISESHETEGATKDYHCSVCDRSYWSDHCDLPTWHYGETGAPRKGYVAIESLLGIFVELSPYYTLARFCSPCAPGAGDLGSPDEDGVKTYCLGHDWFEDGRAPYPVFSVATGALVEPVTP